jgi:hypothetical protein
MRGTVTLVALACVAGAGGTRTTSLAFRPCPSSHQAVMPGGPTSSARASKREQSRVRGLCRPPSGVSQALVRAAAAEWQLLHACETLPAPLFLLQDGVTRGGASDHEVVAQEGDLLGLLYGTLVPAQGDAAAEQCVHAMGMADLPPEASIMQLYEYASAMEKSTQELEAARSNYGSGHRHRTVGPHVRSGIRGGVQAMRGGGGEGEKSHEGYTDVFRVRILPLLAERYCPGDVSWRQIARGARERSWSGGWWDWIYRSCATR